MGHSSSAFVNDTSTTFERTTIEYAQASEDRLWGHVACLVVISVLVVLVFVRFQRKVLLAEFQFQEAGRTVVAQHSVLVESLPRVSMLTSPPLSDRGTLFPSLSACILTVPLEPKLPLPDPLLLQEPLEKVQVQLLQLMKRMHGDHVVHVEVFLPSRIFPPKSVLSSSLGTRLTLFSVCFCVTKMA